MSKLRIIIGQGTATEVYRATLAATDDFVTVVLGPRGLWATLPGGHRMGQTPELLHLPGQPVPPHTTATGKTAQGMTGFLDVNTYQQGLLDLARANDQRLGVGVTTQIGDQTVNLETVMATRVKASILPGKVLVNTTNPNISFLADQVIVATGIGPQSKPDPAIIHGVQANGQGFAQLMEGIAYLDAPPPYGREVAVFGGSASAAWVAYEAMHRARKLLWFTRPGGSEFRGCTLPGDRNFEVLERTKNLRLLAGLKQIDYLPEKRLGNRVLRRPMVKLTLTVAGGAEKVCLVDQLIYSIGGDTSGAGAVANLLDSVLRGRLQPLRDHNRVISDGNGVLALATPDKSVIVIGAATFNYAAPGFTKQSAPMKSLPTASQVPDGIAMITASVQAANSYIPFAQDSFGNVTKANMNLNLANRDQIAVYLAMFYPELRPAATNEIVTRVIALRSAKTPGSEFGITEKKFDEIIQQYA